MGKKHFLNYIKSRGREAKKWDWVKNTRPRLFFSTSAVFITINSHAYLVENTITNETHFLWDADYKVAWTWFFLLVFFWKVLMWTGGIVLYSPVAIVLYKSSAFYEENSLQNFVSGKWKNFVGRTDMLTVRCLLHLMFTIIMVIKILRIRRIYYIFILIFDFSLRFSRPQTWE